MAGEGLSTASRKTPEQHLMRRFKRALPWQLGSGLTLVFVQSPARFLQQYLRHQSAQALESP